MSRKHGVGLACVVALWACQGEATSATQSSAQAQSAKAPAGTPAQNLVNAYLALQTNLAKDDTAGTKAAFADLQQALKAKELPLEPAIAQKLASAVAKGAGAGKIADARAAFSAVTDAMLAFLGSAKNPLTTPLSVAHCPMALDNRGAKWLQLGEKLENPYFGSEMLRCGTVEKTLPPGASL